MLDLGLMFAGAIAIACILLAGCNSGRDHGLPSVLPCVDDDRDDHHRHDDDCPPLPTPTPPLPTPTPKVPA